MTLPRIPQRSDGPSRFADDGDAFLGALPVFEARMEAIDANVTAKEASAVASAQAAYASEFSAVSATNVTKWVSGTTYVVGDVRWSPLNSLSYRRRTAGAGTLDPSEDPANWAQLVTLPPQAGNEGKNLTTDGVNASWVTPTSLPGFLFFAQGII